MTDTNRKNEETFDARTRLVLGDTAVERLAAATVAVAGLGGVGSFAAEALARAGVGKLILIDDDVITVSNRNRQLYALRSTQGMLKVDAACARMRDIREDLPLVLHGTRLTGENAAELLSGAHAVIDAVDDVDAKVAMAVWAQENDVYLVSSMGTGGKLHPESFQCADITKTHTCPLARVMRRRLREKGIAHLRVVFSDEVSVPRREGAPVGSVSFVPPVAGFLLAGDVIRRLCGAEDSDIVY